MASFWDATRRGRNKRTTDKKDLGFSLRRYFVAKKRVFHLHLPGLGIFILLLYSLAVVIVGGLVIHLRLIYDNKWLDKLFNLFSIRG